MNRNVKGIFGKLKWICQVPTKWILIIMVPGNWCDLQNSSTNFVCHCCHIALTIHLELKSILTIIFAFSLNIMTIAQALNANRKMGQSFGCDTAYKRPKLRECASSSDLFALSYLLLRNSMVTCCVAQTNESKKRVRDSYGFY
jgi:hypothetical protein